MLKINRADCQPFLTKDGSEIRELMAWRNSPAKRQSLAEASLPPGGKTTCHRHQLTEEIYYFLAGSGLTLAGDDFFRVGPGDAVLNRPGVRHQTWNLADTTLVFLCCCSPAYEHDDTLLLPEATPPPELASSGGSQHA
ncbi:MAG: cupin domain-containing protein [Planctomycetota bacterium]|jgi:mannose-6-phosphate isomerase-like protein (cupin superfamily)|nr:cupin domain-containing protein [Planctomycetota bacterium]